jgi:hypothetical protein
MRAEEGADMAKSGFAYLRQHHVGLLALFIALGGTAYAASLPRNSVGTAQLKNNAVTSVKVKDHSLLSKDFKAGQLVRGPQGIPGGQGAMGPQGLPGPPGPRGADGRNAATSVSVADSAGVTIAAGATQAATASCPPGSTAVGGGGFTDSGDATMTDSFPTDSPPTTWEVDYRDDTVADDVIHASVVCASP